MTPAGRSSRAWVWLLATIVIGLALDLGSKYIVFHELGPQPVTIRKADVLATQPEAILSLIPESAREPVMIIPGLLDFQRVLNSGAVFGAGSGRRWFFIGFTLVALAFAGVLFARWTSAKDHISHLAIGLIISGGLGNLYDRARYACVRDFIHPLPDAQIPFGLSWPNGESALWPYVSNVADALLLIGIAILMVKLWRTDSDRARAGKQVNASSDDS